MNPNHKNSTKRSRRARRLIKWAVLLAVVAGLAALALHTSPAIVDIGSVSRGPIVIAVTEDGTTSVRERYTVAAPLNGRLRRIGLEPGDPVHKGDTIATLEPTLPTLLDPRTLAQSQARVSAAEAALTTARNHLESATVNATQLKQAFERNLTLHNNGNLSDAGFEKSQREHLTAQLAVGAAGSTIEVSKFELEQARAALLVTTGASDTNIDSTFSIQSPTDAHVLRVLQESSTTVSPGTPLIEIGDPSDLEIRIDVLSQDAVNIHPGQRVIIEHWGGQNPLDATVRTVEPSAFTKVSALGVDEQRVYVVADLVSGPATGESLGDNFRIEARIVTSEAADVLLVPAAALFRNQQGWAAFRIGPDRHTTLVSVEIGRNNGDVAEVLSGLDPDDQVVLHPSDRIRNNIPVKPRS